MFVFLDMSICLHAEVLSQMTSHRQRKPPSLCQNSLQLTYASPNNIEFTAYTRPHDELVSFNWSFFLLFFCEYILCEVWAATSTTSHKLRRRIHVPFSGIMQNAKFAARSNQVLKNDPALVQAGNDSMTTICLAWHAMVR